MIFHKIKWYFALVCMLTLSAKLIADSPQTQRLRKFYLAVLEEQGKEKKYFAHNVIFANREAIADIIDTSDELIIEALGHTNRRNFYSDDFKGPPFVIKEINDFIRKQFRNYQRPRSAYNWLWDLKFDGLGVVLGKFFRNANFSNAPAIIKLLESTKESAAIDPVILDIIKKIIPAYYSSFHEIKPMIMRDLLALPKNASASSELSAFIQNSDPVMQKLFQLIGRELSDRTFVEAMMELHDNVKKAPYVDLQREFKVHAGVEIEKVYKVNPVPLKSGTIGQVHAATNLQNGQEAILKFRRPNVVKLIQKSTKLIKNAADSPFVKQVVEDITRQIADECDFRKEAENIKQGQVYINKNIGLSVVTIDNGFDVNEGFLPLKRAAGINPSSLKTDKELVILGEATSSLLESWFEKAVFSGGFFHGDLHPGNIFIDIDPMLPTSYLMTLIDFGNAAKLDFLEQRGLMYLGYAVAWRSVDAAMSALDFLGAVSESDRENVRNEIVRIFDAKTTFSETFSNIFLSGGKAGVKMSETLVAFNRGKAFLEIQLRQINASLDRVDPNKKLKRFDIESIYKETVLKNRKVVALNLAGFSCFRVKSKILRLLNLN